jgi:hypothetical protein
MNQVPENVLVRRVDFRKCKYSAKHEFVVCHLVENLDGSSGQEPRHSFVIVERLRDSNHHSLTVDTLSSTSGPSSATNTPKSKRLSSPFGSQPALDQFVFSIDGTRLFVDEYAGHSEELMSLDLRDVTFTLAQLILLATLVHDQAVSYSLPNSQWFAACIYDMIEAVTGVPSNKREETKTPAGVPTFLSGITISPSADEDEWRPDRIRALFDIKWAEEERINAGKAVFFTFIISSYHTYHDPGD